MSMKINKLEIENVKRIKAVKVEPKANGLTVIGGNNNQGKTSVLDSIAWALGGERYKPSQATREGSVIPPTLHIVMNNGLVVERKGKNSALKVTDPNGQKAGQQLLNEFVEQLALDLPKFMEASGTEKAKILLQIIGVGPQLAQFEQQEEELYQERLYIGRTADQKEKFAKEQPYFADAPKDLISASELIRQQQEILARNGENQRKREQLCHPASLICENAEVAQKMTENLEKEAGMPVDIEEAEKKASEDVVAQREESLAKQLAEMKRRKKKLVDPLQFEMSIQAEDLSSYVPSFGWEMGPPSDKQKNTLEKLGILPDQIDNAGKAAKFLDRLEKRRNEGLTTPKQIRFLEGRGFQHVGTWQFETAKNLIDRIAGNGWRIPSDIVPQEYKGA